MRGEDDSIKREQVGNITAPSENKNTESLKLNANPLLSDIRFNEGRVDINCGMVISEVINQCNSLRDTKPISFEMLHSSDSICSADGGWGNSRSLGGKSSRESSIETSKGLRHAL